MSPRPPSRLTLGLLLLATALGTGCAGFGPALSYNADEGWSWNVKLYDKTRAQELWDESNPLGE